MGAPGLEPISALALRSDHAGPEAERVVFYMPGATHEFVLQALDPERLIPKDAPIRGSGYRPADPAKHRCQFLATRMMPRWRECRNRGRDRGGGNKPPKPRRRFPLART